MRRMVVTGGGGFIGRALCARLIALRDVEVVAVDNNARGSLEALAPAANLRCVVANVLDAGPMDEVCAGAEVVVHLAAVNGTRHFYEIPATVLEVGIIGTHNVLKAGVRAGVRRIVFVSSSEVYQHADRIPTPETVECRVPDVFNPRLSYGGGKLAGELMTINYLRGSGTEFVIVRPHNVYGPAMGDDHVIPQVVRRIFDGHREGRRPIPVEVEGTGEETRAFMFVDDAARAIELCALEASSGELYHIGVERETTIAQLVREIAGALGKDVAVRASDRPRGSALRRCPDVGKLRGLGFEAAVALEDGVRRTAMWYWEHFQRRIVAEAGAGTSSGRAS